MNDRDWMRRRFRGRVRGCAGVAAAATVGVMIVGSAAGAAIWAWVA